MESLVVKPGFEAAFSHVLGVEGGFTDRPEDRGGPTNLGITQKMLSAFRGYPASPEDLRHLTQEEAREIYRCFFWDPMRLDLVENPVLALMIFDQAVNRGPRATALMLQRLLGLAEDGAIGPKTLGALNSADLNFSLRFFAQIQVAYCQLVQRDPSQLVFLTGWMSRTHSLLGCLIRG